MHFVVVAQGLPLLLRPFSCLDLLCGFFTFALGNARLVNLFCSFRIAIAVSVSLASLHLCAPVLATHLACVVHKFFLEGSEPFIFFAFSSAMHLVVSRETFDCALFPHLDAEFGTFCCGGGFALGARCFLPFARLYFACLLGCVFFVRILF